MIIFSAVSIVLAIAAIGFLGYALINPERFK
ncbi:potassium-transporting ATPase subunit F [Lysinibacter sp. HNR]|nr:potassium-transporting ATPase subunit F [Lysinibacter sp. HNR]WGD37953.1 potassium-transporting ATPase subunit F [Lysinibacter sp. HNR]